MFYSKSILLFFPAFLFISCSQQRESSEQVNNTSSGLHLNPAQEQSLGITTTEVQIRLTPMKLKVSGFIDVPPQNLISISLPMGGFLKHTELLSGMEISKGQIIAVLEDASYLQLQQDYLETSLRYEQLKTEAFRLRDLEKNKAASTREYLKAKTDADAAEIQHRALEEKLKMLGIQPSGLTAKNMSPEIRLVSPVHGFVSEVKVNKGKYIQAGESLFELVDPEDIHLNLKVLEGDLPFVSEGQNVEAWTNHDPKVKHKASVILVSRTLGADKSSEVHCHFDSPQKGLVPGMFMNAELYAGSDSMPVIPAASVIRDGSHHFVIASAGKGSYEFIEVNTLEQMEDDMILKTDDKLRGRKIVQGGAWGLWMSFKNQNQQEQAP